MPAAPRARHSGGVHFLAVPRIARKLVQSCPLDHTDLVVEFGAGQGAITTHLAETGARILAVERDPEFIRKLHNRFAQRDNVRVIQADARQVPLPHKRFSVVASIPYALSTALLRRLLGSRRTTLTRAALIVEWGFARRLAATVPRDLEQAWWAARFEIRIASRISAHCFSPPPRVDSAHIVVTRGKPVPERPLWTLLATAYRDPHQPVRRVVARPRTLRAAGIDPTRPAGLVAPTAWAELARHLAADRGLHWPPLPRRIR
ncbi:ribosomal RNA small subunit methyltransferase A [Amycolatopsis alkalitolerans]|uniref:Methyltransferase domain-containing protein n=1 Tax=Amycolatopsis alkalitolerans TaxID=2547244 RepID=A0A5C4LYE1_9PSEU|nr:rRNA adenine N(6)-methyltransferase family protein [Amycolatopsis alkalitolerans]TNC24616.1 methyltransferase domain-containing protein [Amycolatopsis alkalitolerans]